jgi:dihydropteroate synthase
MPGLIDAVSAARVRTEQAERLLAEGLRFVSDDAERARPEAEWRSVAEKALRHSAPWKNPPGAYAKPSRPTILVARRGRTVPDLERAAPIGV